MFLHKFFFSLLLLPALAFAHNPDKHGANGGARGLRNVTVLIVRHAEKPDEGSGLSARGEQRAQAYASYFAPLRLDGDQTLLPQRLIATSDSKSSARPRLTLTPLAERLQVPLEQPYADEQVDKLVKSLRKENQAAVVLIAWHHGHIADLIDSFGGDTQSLLGSNKWPGDVYNWLIVLHFDEHGRLIASASQRVQEHLLPGD